MFSRRHEHDKKGGDKEGKKPRKHDDGRGKSKRQGRRPDRAEFLAQILQQKQALLDLLTQQNDEFERLREQSQSFQQRLQEAEQELLLLSSSGETARLARNASPYSNQDDHRLYNMARARRELAREVDGIEASVQYFTEQMTNMGTAIEGTEREIAALEERIAQIAIEDSTSDSQGYPDLGPSGASGGGPSGGFGSNWHGGTRG